MKKYAIIAATSLLFCSNMAISQELKTAYFLDDRNVYGYRINPAAAPNEGTTGYFGLLFNNVNTGAQSNLGMSNLFFPVNGELVFGLNKNVPASQFLGGLKEKNNLGVSENYSILSFGTRLKKGFLSFDVNVKSSASASVPKSIFKFLKEGSENKVYAVENVRADVFSYMELAANYSHRINENLSVGAGLKFMVGVANASLNAARMQISTDQKINVKGEGTFFAAAPIINFPVNSDGIIDFSKTGFAMSSISPAGFGAAIDLGARWNTPVDGLSLDIALLNLGGISWSNAITGEMLADFDVTGQELTMDKILQFKKKNSNGSEFVMLPVTANIGAKYVMPFYNRMSAGILGSFQFGTYSSYDLRLGVNVTPVNAIGIAISGGVNSYGALAGAVVNFRIPGVNFFAGVDGFITKFTPQFIPVNPVNNVTKFGITFVFGNNH